MLEWFCVLADKVEKLFGHPYALALFSLAFVIGVAIDVDVTNIANSYITAGLLFLTIGSRRRSEKAMHAKLDDLVENIPEADTNKKRLEDKQEDEIESVRK